MKLIQSLFTLMISLILLSIFWPLFVFFMIVIVVYFLIIKTKVQSRFDSSDSTQHTIHKDPNVIDVEVVAEKEEK